LLLAVRTLQPGVVLKPAAGNQIPLLAPEPGKRHYTYLNMHYNPCDMIRHYKHMNTKLMLHAALSK
jgi:hypothetical protein